MKNLMRKTPPIALLVLLIAFSMEGCATFSRKSLNDIQVGMSEAEIKHAFGRPDHKKARGNEEVLVYKDDDPLTDDMSEYWLVFRDGKLFSFGRAGDFNNAIPNQRYEVNIHNDGGNK